MFTMLDRSVTFWGGSNRGSGYAPAETVGIDHNSGFSVDELWDIVFRLDCKGVITFVNAACSAVLGLSCDEIMGRNIIELLYHEDITPMKKRLGERVRGELVDQPFEFRVIDSMGNVVFFEATTQGVFNGAELVGIQGIARDVSSRKELEDSRRKDMEEMIKKVHLSSYDLTETKRKLLLEKYRRQQGDQRYQRLVEVLPVVSFRMVVRGAARITYISPQVKQLTGYTSDEWTSDSELWQRVLHPEDISGFLDAFNRLCRCKEAVQLDYRVITRDCSVCWIRSYVDLECDDSGEPYIIHGIMLDVTEQKKAEEAVRFSEQRYRAFFCHNPNPIMVVDITELIHSLCELGSSEDFPKIVQEMTSFEVMNTLKKVQIDESNEAALDLLGMTEPSQLIANLSHIYSDAKAAKATLYAFVVLVGDGGIVEDEIKLNSLDGRSIEVSFRMGLFSKEVAMPIKVMIAVTDLTQEHHLQRAVLSIADDERARLGAELHDTLTQQLGGIAMLSAVLADKLAEEKSQDENVVTEARRVAELASVAVRDARVLARGCFPVEMNDDSNLSGALEQLARDVSRRYGIQCACKLCEEIEFVPIVIAQQIYRILQEAVNNAVKHAQADRILLCIRYDQSQLILRVEDNGCGIAMGAAHGGLGMAIMRHRAERLGGELTFYSVKPGSGTKVCCLVPWQT